MISQRNEAFRYTFDEPIDALFEITKIDDDIVSTSEGKAKIFDISPTGIKLNTHLKIPKTDHKSIELSISFKINDKEIDVTGVIVWMQINHSSVDYGIDLNIDESTKQQIIDQLKIYSKKAIVEK